MRQVAAKGGQVVSVHRYPPRHTVGVPAPVPVVRVPLSDLCPLSALFHYVVAHPACRGVRMLCSVWVHDADDAEQWLVDAMTDGWERR